MKNEFQIDPKEEMRFNNYIPANEVDKMETVRFIGRGTQSFYGDYLYDLIIPEDHFLRKLNAIIAWERFTRKLIRLYKGEGVVGRPPFDPALLLKVELIAYLYNLSERQVEVYINENLPAKYFVGLAVDQKEWPIVELFHSGKPF